jgi:hypothetical protein
MRTCYEKSSYPFDGYAYVVDGQVDSNNLIQVVVNTVILSGFTTVATGSSEHETRCYGS